MIQRFAEYVLVPIGKEKSIILRFPVLLLYLHGFSGDQGWGLLKLRSLISPLREILILQKYWLNTYNHVHICQVSPQLSCGDTAKYELDIIQVTIVFIISKDWENNGTEKIGLVTPTHVLSSRGFPYHWRVAANTATQIPDESLHNTKPSTVQIT